jgi:hypothetical protein
MKSPILACLFGATFAIGIFGASAANADDAGFLNDLESAGFEVNGGKDTTPLVDAGHYVCRLADTGLKPAAIILVLGDTMGAASDYAVPFTIASVKNLCPEYASLLRGLS